MNCTHTSRECKRRQRAAVPRERLEGKFRVSVRRQRKRRGQSSTARRSTEPPNQNHDCKRATASYKELMELPPSYRLFRRCSVLEKAFKHFLKPKPPADLFAVRESPEEQRRFILRQEDLEAGITTTPPVGSRWAEKGKQQRNGLSSHSLFCFCPAVEKLRAQKRSRWPGRNPRCPGRRSVPPNSRLEKRNQVKTKEKLPPLYSSAHVCSPQNVFSAMKTYSPLKSDCTVRFPR